MDHQQYSPAITYNVYQSIRHAVDNMDNTDARVVFKHVGGMDVQCGNLFLPKYGITVGQFAYVRLGRTRTADKTHFK